MPRSSGSSMRTRTIGRSPEIWWAQRADGPAVFRRSTSGAERIARSEYRMRLARSWKSWASCGSMPRWWSCTCAWVQARVTVRSKVAGSRYLSASATAVSRDGATSVEKMSRAHSPGREPDPAPQAEDRIEHRARGVRQGPTVDDGHRGADRAAAAQEAGPVRLALGAARGLAFHHDGVGGPHRGLRRRAHAAGGQQRAEVGEELGLDEQVGEGGVGRVGRRRGELELGVGGELQLPDPVTPVRDRDAPDLGVVLGRDDDLEHGRDRAVQPIELRAVLRERHAVDGRLDAGGLVRGRPDRAALDVAQEHVRAPRIPRHVLPPARHAEAGAPAVARSRGGQHHGVAPVGQQVRAGSRPVGRGEAAEDGLHELADVRRHVHFLEAGAGDRDVVGHALLQEQVGGPDHGLGVEPLAHDPVVEHVSQGDEGHALVVGHVGAHDRHRRAVRHPRRGVVEGLVEAVGPERPHRGERGEVPRRRDRVDHRGERGRVGGHHQVLAQAALEAEARHAEVRVLVGEIQIADVVGRLGDAPRHAVVGAVADLALDHEPARVLEEAADGGLHHERGHQVLEHRARPGHQDRAEPDRGHLAAEVEPVRDGHVALGDGDEAREAGFRGQEIVGAAVEAAVRDAVADREDLAGRVEEEAELHGLEELGGGARDAQEAAGERAGGGGGSRQALDERVDARDRRRRRVGARAEGGVAGGGELVHRGAAPLGQVGRAGR